ARALTGSARLSRPAAADGRRHPLRPQRRRTARAARDNRPDRPYEVVEQQGPLVTTGHDLYLDHGRGLVRADVRRPRSSGWLPQPAATPERAEGAGIWRRPPSSSGRQVVRDLAGAGTLPGRGGPTRVSHTLPKPLFGAHLRRTTNARVNHQDD